VSIFRNLRQWWQITTGEEETPFDVDVLSFFASLLVHVGLVAALAFVVLPVEEVKPEIVVLSDPPLEAIEEIILPPEEFSVSDIPVDEVGAGSKLGDGMAISLAPEIAPVTDIPIPVDTVESTAPEFEINNTFDVPAAISVQEMVAIKGTAGEGTTGAEGAVDRLTFEILQSLDDNKTLVVWLFDQSPSMIKQRATVNERFERIYRELGMIEASGTTTFSKHEDKPLLTSVMCFGSDVKWMTKEPTDNLAEIQEAVNKIPADDSGDEMTFTAVLKAAQKFAHYRNSGSDKRNVMLVVFSDEIGSDANERLDTTVKTCRRLAMPVYVVGVPAPFGQRETHVKWVDPDPKFDQTPQWGVVEQGPESMFPEFVQIGSGQIAFEESAPIDSGFGPFALTRLAYETGGIYFTVHSSRDSNRAVTQASIQPFEAHLKYFYDPEAMRRYKPDYVSFDESVRRVQKNKCRQALVTAARASLVGEMQDPQLRFPKRDEGQFSESLTQAQRAAALLEPRIDEMFEKLKFGEADRAKELTPRWQAGYDLAMGRVMAAKVRTETYNAMLATAKRGLKAADPKTNVWVLQPADTVTVGSQMSQMAEKAKTYLKRVAADHAGTPWAHMAEKELATPIGWKWTEDYIPPPPPPPKMAPAAANNPPPARPRDEEKMMLDRPKARPVPKKL
jgi:hypothetical protein